MGRRVLPPTAGSPLRLRCSSTIRERRFGSRRGRQGTGSTTTSTLSLADTATSPSPSRRQSFLTCASFSRPRPRGEARTASQTSSYAGSRSTACSSKSSVKVSFNSAMTTENGDALVERNDVTPAHLTLHLEAEAIEKSLYRPVKDCFCTHSGAVMSNSRGSRCRLSYHIRRQIIAYTKADLDRSGLGDG